MIDLGHISFLPSELLLQILDDVLHYSPEVDARLSYIYPTVIPAEYWWKTELTPRDKARSWNSQLQTIRQVCQLWNDLAVSNPSWWTYIDLRFKSSWISTQLSRANNELLHVIDDGQSTPSTVMTTLSNRIGSLSVKRGLYGPTPIRPSSMRSLKTFHLDMIPCSNAMEPTWLRFNFNELFNSSTPHLTALFLIHTMGSPMLPTLGNLEILSLQVTYWRSSQFHQFLQDCSARLRVLHIDCLKLGPARLVVPLQITFQNVSSLELESVPADFLRMLSDSLQFPACTYLYLRCSKNIVGHLTAFLELFKQIWVTQSELAETAVETTLVLQVWGVTLKIGSARCQFAHHDMDGFGKSKASDVLRTWLLDPCLASVSQTTLDLTSRRDCHEIYAKHLLEFLDPLPRICRTIIISGDAGSHDLMSSMRSKTHDIMRWFLADTVTLELDHCLRPCEMDMLGEMVEQRSMTREGGGLSSLTKIIVRTRDEAVASVLRDMFVKWKDWGIDGSLEEEPMSIGTSWRI